MTEQTLVYPPRVTEFTRTFWEGLGEGRFLTSRCVRCGHLTFPPKPICPECWGSDVEWVPLSGRGTLVSYTEVSAAPQMFAQEAPYRLCIVDLEEGVRCVSRILDEWDALQPDAPVRLRVREAEPVCLFEFELDPSTSEAR